MRYTKDDKLKYVMMHINGEYIPNPIGGSRKTILNKIREWRKIYEVLGEVGLEHNKPILTLEDKLIICERVDAGESMSAIAVSYGRQEANVSRIYKCYSQYGIDGLKSTKKKGRPPTMKKKVEVNVNELTLEERIKILEKENERLQIENEYLKKLDALVQKRMDRQQKKK